MLFAEPKAATQQLVEPVTATPNASNKAAKETSNDESDVEMDIEVGEEVAVDDEHVDVDE